MQALSSQWDAHPAKTYDVDDPDMTAVADLDGQWICFAYESSAPDTPVTVFDILVTNTTDNAADAMWMTIADCDYSASGNPRYLDALQFKLSCDNSALTFSLHFGRGRSAPGPATTSISDRATTRPDTPEPSPPRAIP